MKKRLKTMTCLLLAVILCVSVLPFPVMAANAQAQVSVRIIARTVAKNLLMGFPS